MSPTVCLCALQMVHVLPLAVAEYPGWSICPTEMSVAAMSSVCNTSFSTIKVVDFLLGISSLRLPQPIALNECLFTVLMALGAMVE